MSVRERRKDERRSGTYHTEPRAKEPVSLDRPTLATYQAVAIVHQRRESGLAEVLCRHVGQEHVLAREGPDRLTRLGHEHVAKHLARPGKREKGRRIRVTSDLSRDASRGSNASAFEWQVKGTGTATHLAQDVDGHVLEVLESSRVASSPARRLGLPFALGSRAEGGARALGSRCFDCSRGGRVGEHPSRVLHTSATYQSHLSRPPPRRAPAARRRRLEPC